jgi:hypothetical protein
MCVSDQKPAYLRDWPGGVYEIPDTNVLISDVMGDESTLGSQAALGFIGHEIEGGKIAGATQEKIKGFEKDLNLDLPAMAKDCIQYEYNQIKDKGQIKYSEKPDESEIQITPYAVFNFSGDTQSQLWAVLKVELNPFNHHFDDWKCRYIVGLGPFRPMGGEGGLTADQDKILKQDLNYNLQMAANGQLGRGTCPGRRQ